jgi:hypothetical protein
MTALPVVGAESTIERRSRFRAFSAPAVPLLFGSLVLAMLIGILAAPVPARAQESCAACWGNVTQWHGTWSLTLVGSGINNSSQGTFDISNGVYSVTGTGSVSGSSPLCFCSCSGSGALDASSSALVQINTTDCTYSLILNDRLQYVLTLPPPISPVSSIETCSGNTVVPIGTIPEAVLPHFPLPAYGEALVGSGTFSAPFPGVGCYFEGGATLTISWNIEPVVPSGEPRFTHIPTGGDLGCNPANTPDIGSVLGDTDATAPSGQVSISADSVDVTVDCRVARSFSLTATDTCTQQEAHALVVYSWTEDTTPPAITGVPTGGNLGCNPANKPTDANLKALLAVTDDCGSATPLISHADTTNGCTVTRTFTVSATDACGNASDTKTAVFTWTMDDEPPVITSVPAGGSLGCNPTSLPTDASVRAQAQASDHCGAATVNVSHADHTDGCTMTRTFTITASDGCGNISAASTVVYTWTADPAPPTFTQLPPGGYLGTNPPCVPDDGAVQAQAQAGDNCGVASVTATHTDTGDSNLHTRTFTITAIDDCGNSALANVTYTWSGTADPIGSAPSLSILRSGSNVRLDWPTNADCFCLISRTSLRSGFWTAVTDAPAVLSGRFVVTNRVTAPSRFYRLAR